MKHVTLAIALASTGLIHAPHALAQLIPAKYTGNMSFTTSSGHSRTALVEFKVDKVEGGAVQGTVLRSSGGFCAGEVPVVGVLDGDNLTLEPLKGATKLKEGCGFTWGLKVNGAKLEGKSATSGTVIELSR